MRIQGQSLVRIAAQLAGVAVVGMLIGFGCSTSDTDASPGGGAGKGAARQEAGSGGIDEPAAEGGAAGVVRTPSASGGAPVETEGGAAGAGGACAGDYLCPLVGWSSHATLTFDLPVSVTDTANAVFTACRNSECHTAKGNATVALNGNPEWGWVDEVGGLSVYLTFGGSASAPFGVLRWDFLQDFVTIPSDHYSLSMQPVGAPGAISLFDTEVSYAIVAADPTLVDEGFCHRCSEVSSADLDLRAAK